MAGNAVTVEGTFKTSTGGLVDPTTVRLLYRNPVTGAVTVKSTTASELAHSSLGVFSFVIAPTSTEHGEWRYRFEGSGTAVTAGEEEFHVEPAGVST